MSEMKIQDISQTGSSVDAQIFTMPEAYRQGKEAKMVEPVRENKSAPVAVLPPVQKPPVLQKPHSKTQTHHALLVAGVLVLLAVAISGYLLLRSAQKQEPVVSKNDPTVPSTPAPIVETPSPIEQPTPETQITENPFATEIVPGKDSDSDGLTDLEETSVYKTDSRLPDTDSDGFLDGNEVFHRYNPGGIAPGTLLEAGLVSVRQINQSTHLSYPIGWTVKDLASQPPAFSFLATTGESINLTVVTPTNESQIQTRLSDWIAVQGGQERVVQTLSKSGYTLYVAQDNRHAFLVVEQTILEFTYELGTKTTLDYLQTFKMMLNSVSL